MEKLGREFFNKFREKIRRQKEILICFEDCSNEVRTKKYFEEKSRLEELLLHEEAYWRQRAKSFWLLDGDPNSKYFHAYATTRKKRNMITQLRTDSGDIVTNHVDMCKVVQDYFGNLFGLDGNMNEEELDSFDPVLTKEQRNSLEVDFTFEEFSVAIKQMHPDKSAGPDGLNPAFYQHFWKMLGKELFSSCKQWLNDL